MARNTVKNNREEPRSFSRTMTMMELPQASTSGAKGLGSGSITGPTRQVGVGGGRAPLGGGGRVVPAGGQDDGQGHEPQLGGPAGGGVGAGGGGSGGRAGPAAHRVGSVTGEVAVVAVAGASPGGADVAVTPAIASWACSRRATNRSASERLAKRWPFWTSRRSASVRSAAVSSVWRSTVGC